jgi:hypothetical protein
MGIVYKIKYPYTFVGCCCHFHNRCNTITGDVPVICEGVQPRAGSAEIVRSRGNL